jgi:hypothetical protein
MVSTDSGEGERPRLANEWRPDWTIAPSEILEAWLQEKRLTARGSAAHCADPAVVMLAMREVYAREPLTQRHAELLAEATGVPSRLWLGAEKTYRGDLAAGRKDVTEASLPLPGEEGSA